MGKMKIMHIGGFVENEAKEYPNAKAVSVGDLDRITLYKGKVANPKKETFASRSRNPLFVPLSEGNKKLKATDSVKFLIWNLPSVSTCPYRTALCEKFCYAKKSERVYPDVLPSRQKHMEISKGAEFVERMTFTIESYLLKPSYKNAKKIVVRIHESGDFYNQRYANNWLEIAEHFKTDKRVVFMAYTKSIGFFSNNIYSDIRKPIPNNMVVRFSVWDDTKPDYIALAERWDFPIYTAVEEFTKEIPSQNRCRCKDCATCGKCWSKTKTLVCEIH